MTSIKEPNKWEYLILLQRITSGQSLSKPKKSIQNRFWKFIQKIELNLFFSHKEIISNLKQGIHK
jgi:hypothetical protein